MTAEIAILNNHGIALAADSAVTIGSDKVYNSANKLFSLSKYNPVGIMVYDSADLIGIPWEIIIKEFRAELGSEEYDTLQEYADHFWEFVSQNNQVIPKENKDNYILHQAITYLNSLFSELEKSASNIIQDEGETNLNQSISTLVSLIGQHEDILSQTPFLEKLNEDYAVELLGNWRDEFLGLCEQKLGEVFLSIEEEDKSRLIRLISLLFVKDKFLLRSSGVVIAGFGKEEMFPKISSYIIEGVFTNKVKMKFENNKSNTHENNFVTTIIPFAQDEMVWTFLSGVDPDVEKFASDYINNIFNLYPGVLEASDFDISEETMQLIRTKLLEYREAIVSDYNKEILNFRRANNSKPIIDMVGVLPKDELAAMAESLVNLTVFKRRVTKSVETVGGPIDVAIISKGDGFIWVKRKHYFKPELNPQFFSNYYKGGV